MGIGVTPSVLLGEMLSPEGPSGWAPPPWGGSDAVSLFSRLVQEVNEINETLRNLHQCLRASEDMLQMLVRSKGVLEHDLVVKNNSLFIDQERCMGMRKSYPSTVQILGYVSAGLT